MHFKRQRQTLQFQEAVSKKNSAHKETFSYEA